ncbi:hypothetical protein [Paenibacillus dendritiformis]|uniref:hypothetical protein n=2 Tax=Paenibacillus dendritiformis TaxID=130049 RepID=UPI00143D505E|nr:hypothetical protein [Paenibacillus dendritiformis]NKI22233.1 hypothetical protein [Paenibacillus dendritiformis]NRG00703.1 hypothetical protein [Paenibacillus dendritiformis]
MLAFWTLLCRCRGRRTDRRTRAHDDFTAHMIGRLLLGMLLPGNLFTVSIIYIDPMRYRTSFMYRAIVQVTEMCASMPSCPNIPARPPLRERSRAPEPPGNFIFGSSLLRIS